MPSIGKQEVQTQIRYCRKNLERANNLFEVFDASRPKSVGKVSHLLKDVLRSSVVFTHAAIDNLIRSLYRAHLKACTPGQLEEETKANKFDKISHEDLASCKGKTVDQFLEERIEAFLIQKSFNSSDEVFRFLKKFSIEPQISNTQKSQITAMIQRRHKIVHRHDENPKKGQRGVHPSEDIARKAVKGWIDASAALINAIEVEVKKWK